jgi:hypothetical protein
MLVPLVIGSTLYNMIAERERVPSVRYILPIFSTTAKNSLLRRFILTPCWYIHGWILTKNIWGDGQTRCDTELQILVVLRSEIILGIPWLAVMPKGLPSPERSRLMLIARSIKLLLLF